MAKGNNKYALGNTLGRPPKFAKAEDLSKKISQYFDSLQHESKGDETEQFPDPPTVTGLALFLGFESRQSIYDYAKKEGAFSYIIKRALTVIENHYETRLNYNSPTGAIFALKNMNWSDKSEVDLNATIKRAAFRWGDEEPEAENE